MKKQITTIFRFITAFLLFFSASHLLGQDLLEMNLEDLLNMDVTTASKKAEKLSDAPGIISTITSQEIKNFGANTVYEVLEMAPSLQPLGSHLFVQNKAAIRGELNTHTDNHVLVLINGRPVREGTSGGSNSTIYQGFPVEMIDRIEIIRGPGSVLYGTNAFAGVINIITKGAGSENNLNLTAGAGSFGTTIGAATGSYSAGDFRANLGAKLYSQDGWDFEMTTSRPGSDDLPVNMEYGQKSLTVVADVSYKNLKVLGMYINNSQDALGILPYAPFAGINKYSRYFINAGYDYELSETWEASLNVTTDFGDYTLQDEAVIPSDHHSYNDYLAEATVSGTLAEDLNIIFGGVVYARNKNNSEAGDVVAEYHQTHLSGYVQADYRPVKALKLILGAQINKPDEGDADVVPRIGAIYHFTDQFGVKALYAQAFRSPWPLEQLIVNPVLHGNPDLGPEKVATTDFQLFYTGQSAEASLTYFISNYSDLITRIPYAEGGLTFTNQGTMDFAGIELTGKKSISKNVFITGSATYYSKDEDISPLPDAMVKLGAFYNTDFGLTAGLYNTYYGAPKSNGAPEVNPTADAVDLLDATFSYKIPVSVPVELSVTVKNLLNSDYYFTEYARNWVNTFPVGPGTAVYAKVNVKI